MSKTKNSNTSDEGKNSQFRSARRQRQRRDSQDRSSTRSRRGRERRLSVRGELREEPDVRKLARAVIQMALAQAEADAHATADTTDRNEAPHV